MNRPNHVPRASAGFTLAAPVAEFDGIRLFRCTLQIMRFLLLNSIALVASCQVATATEREETVEEPAAIEVQNLCILPSGKIILKCKNGGGRPVKAFKGKWVVFDDFNEASQSGDILFTTNTPVMESAAPIAPFGGYLVQPDGIIYLLIEGKDRVAMVGKMASDGFGNLDEMPPQIKKRFKAVITKIIFAEAEEVDNARKREDAARKREDAARERERLQQLEIRAEDAAPQKEAAMESITTTKAGVDSLTELSPERIVTDVWDKDPRVTVSNFRSQYADKLVRYTGIVVRLNQKEHLLVFKGGGFMTHAYDVQVSLKDDRNPGLLRLPLAIGSLSPRPRIGLFRQPLA